MGQDEADAIDHYREGLYKILRGTPNPREVAASYLGEDLAGETGGPEASADDAYDVAVGALAATPVPPGLRRALAELGVSMRRYDVVRRAVQERVRAEVGKGEGLVRDMSRWPEVLAEVGAKNKLIAARRAVEAGARAWVEGPREGRVTVEFAGRAAAEPTPKLGTLTPNCPRPAPCAKVGFHAADECAVDEPTCSTSVVAPPGQVVGEP